MKSEILLSENTCKYCVHNVTSSTVTTRSGPLLFITSRECVSPFFFIFFFFRPEEKEPLLLLVASCMFSLLFNEA